MGVYWWQTVILTLTPDLSHIPTHTTTHTHTYRSSHRDSLHTRTVLNFLVFLLQQFADDRELPITQASLICLPWFKLHNFHHTHVGPVHRIDYSDRSPVLP